MYMTKAIPSPNTANADEATNKKQGPCESKIIHGSREMKIAPVVKQIPPGFKPYSGGGQKRRRKKRTKKKSRRKKRKTLKKKRKRRKKKRKTRR